MLLDNKNCTDQGSAPKEWCKFAIVQHFTHLVSTGLCWDYYKCFPVDLPTNSSSGVTLNLCVKSHCQEQNKIKSFNNHREKGQ